MRTYVVRLKDRLRRLRTVVAEVHRHVDLEIPLLVVAMVSVMAAAAVVAPLPIGPSRTTFYEMVATVCATALIAVVIDSRNVSPPTLSTPRERAGLLLGLTVGLLLSILSSLVAVGVGHGSPFLFGVSTSAGAIALLLLLLAVTLRAAEYGGTALSDLAGSLDGEPGDSESIDAVAYD